VQALEDDLTNSHEDSAMKCQDEILQATVQHCLCIEYPPPRSYIHSFLKKFINMIDESNSEIHHTALDLYTDLMSKSETQESGYRTYFLDDGATSISLKENVSIISDGTTGLCTWQAAFYLAEWCLANSDQINGKKVVELGSGLGLVGLTCWKKCKPSSLILTDFHPKVLETLVHNVGNQFSKEGTISNSDEWGTHFRLSDAILSVQFLDWIAFSERNSNDHHIEGEIILASDVVYDLDIIPSLTTTLSKLLSRTTSSGIRPVAIIACTIRNEETERHFLSQIVERGMSFIELPPVPQVFHCDRMYPVRLYKIHY